MPFKYLLLNEDRTPRGEFSSAVCDWRVGDPVMLKPGEVFRIREIEALEGDEYVGAMVLATDPRERSGQFRSPGT